MAQRGIDWLAVLSKFVRDNPKTSAILAFNLGVMAANAGKKVRGASLSLSHMTEIPAKLIELVPSVKDLGAYLPGVGSKPAQTRKKSRKPASRQRASAKRRKSS